MQELGYFLNIDKPPGLTSRDVVDRVARIAGTKRVGHAGTLDPMATGVLVVAVDRATRLVEYVQAQPKTYRAEFLLGQSSVTDDIEGDVQIHKIARPPSFADIESALAAFVGTIDQKPPAYSALKVAGQRAYRLARKGHDVDLAPRKVQIHSIDEIEYSYPTVSLRIVCGSGTYIRSIARELGERLGVGGLMCRLRRTAVGVFVESTAVPLDDLTIESAASCSLPLSNAVALLPAVHLDDSDARRFQLGQKCRPAAAHDAPEAAVFFGPAGTLLGIGRVVDHTLQPLKGGFARDQRNK